MGRGGGETGKLLPVKRRGKMRISQIDVPRDPWIEAMPRRATSEEVSNPRPNITPKGYIFHALMGYTFALISLFPFSYPHIPDQTLLLPAPPKQKPKSMTSQGGKGPYINIPINELKHPLKQHKQTARPINFKLLIIIHIRRNQLLQLLVEFISDIGVDGCE